MNPPKNAGGPVPPGPADNDPNCHQNDNPVNEIERFLRVLHGEPDIVFEVRMPNCKERPGRDFVSTTVGYYSYDHIAKAAADIASHDAAGLPSVVYITLNPVGSGLLARAVNRLKKKVKEAAVDKDIVRRRWVLIDCDPKRLSGVSSTNAELNLAKEKSQQIRVFLTAAGWPDPVVVMSGNGMHLLYRIDLPTDDGGLVQRVLKALATKFDDEQVKIDTSVHNAARITKLAGTLAAGKGDDLRGVAGVEDRPHRRARLLEVPDPVCVVSRDLLEAVGGPAPAPAPPSPGPQAKGAGASGFDRFDHTPAGVQAYLERRGIAVTRVVRKGSATLLHLERCPVVPDCVSGSGSDITVIVGDDGKIAYKNFHNRGEGLTWLDVREALEPGYKAHAQRLNAVGPSPSAYAAWGSAAAFDAAAAPDVHITVDDAWPLPLPLHSRACAFPPEAFPPGLEQVADYLGAISEAYQVPVDLPAMLAMSAAGLPLSHIVRVRLGPEWLQPPNHYNVILLESANRKTGPYLELTSPLVAWEAEEAERLGPMIAAHNAELDMKRRRIERLKDLATGKALPRKNGNEPTGKEAERAVIELEKELAKENPQTVPQMLVSDITPEELAKVLAANGERLGVFSDESEAIEVFLGRYGDRPNIQLYNKGYDGSAYRINRVSRGPLLLKRPLLSVGLTIQPESVRDFLTDRKAKGTGLIARFGMALPHSLLGSRKINPSSIPKGLRAGWQRALQVLLRGKIDSKDPPEVTLDERARGVFHAFCAEVEPRLSWCGEFQAFGMQDWGGKLCGKIGRTALVLHGLRYAMGAAGSLTEPISEAEMVAAIAWAPYLIDHAKAVMRWVGADEAAVSAHRILAWVARNQPDRFSAQDCFTACRNVQITKADDLREPLELLCALQYLRLLSPDGPPKPGRPKSPVFAVNPRWDRGAG